MEKVNIGDIFQTTIDEWFQITNIKGDDIFWRPLIGGYTEWNKTLPVGATIYKKQLINQNASNSAPLCCEFCGADKGLKHGYLPNGNICPKSYNDQ
jgi:hypothetical protein